MDAIRLTGVRMIIPGIMACQSDLIPPSDATFEYIESGYFSTGNPSGPSSVSFGTEDATRQLLLISVGQWFPSGTVAQTFDSPFSTADRYSFRAPDGTVLTNSFPSYTNRDSTMLTDVYPLGTSGNINLSHGSGLSYNAAETHGAFWLFSLYELNKQAGPSWQSGGTSNDVDVLIPDGGVLTVFFANDSPGASINFGSKNGNTESSDNFEWQCWSYQNTTGSEESKTVTVTGGGILRYLIVSLWS